MGLTGQAVVFAAEQAVPQGSPVPLEQLGSAGEEARWKAAAGLAQSPPEVVPQIAEKLKDSNVEVRRYAALALGMIGKKAKAAVPGLLQALGDKEAKVRRNAAAALRAIGADGKSVVPALTALLTDPDPGVVFAATRALGQFGADAAAAAGPLEQVLRTAKAENLQWATSYALDSIVGPRTEPPKREKLVVEGHVLNKHVRMLDGQWQGLRVAADGICYFAAGGHWANHGSAFFCYDPRTRAVKMLCEDISPICGEDIRKTPPQGKIHSEIVEKDGWLYFGTHLADYTPQGIDRFTGGHLLGYEFATGKFRDFGVVHTNYTNYSGIGIDRGRDLIYFYVTPFGKGDGPRLYRVDIKTGKKQDLGVLLGKTKDEHRPAFHIFVDRRGDCWFEIRSDLGTLYCARGATGKIERWPSALPPHPDAWDWHGELPGGDRCLVMAGEDLCLFDPTEDRDSPAAFFPIKKTGRVHLGAGREGNRFFYAPVCQLAPGRRETRLRSLELAPASRPAIVDHGLLVDQDGRVSSGIWGLDVRNGRVFTIGRWIVKPGEEKTIGVDRHGTFYAVIFAVADLSADLRGQSR
jgi:hypothetical protein